MSRAWSTDGFLVAGDDLLFVWAGCPVSECSTAETLSLRSGIMPSVTSSSYIPSGCPLDGIASLGQTPATINLRHASRRPSDRMSLSLSSLSTYLRYFVSIVPAPRMHDAPSVDNSTWMATIFTVTDDTFVTTVCTRLTITSCLLTATSSTCQKFFSSSFECG